MALATSVALSGCSSSPGGTTPPPASSSPSIEAGTIPTGSSDASVATANEASASSPSSGSSSSGSPSLDASTATPGSADSSVPPAPGDSGGAASADAGAGAADGGAGSSDGGNGSEAGSGCPGVPIVPNATGFIAPGSNSVGIHGSWFVYSDCNDLKNQNCAVVTTPSPTASAFPNVGGKMCTTGQNPTATNPNAWGAGIAFELNDGPPQMPYDTTQSGVTGFCFDLSGPTIPTLHVAYTTVENNDDAPFEAITTPGTHTVLFSDTAELAGEPVFTFDRTKVVLVQFQIPSSPTAPVAWDFCIDGVTAVTQ